MRLHYVIPVGVLAVALGACSSHKQSSGCNLSSTSSCSGGNVCEQLASGGTICAAPLVLTGKVTDLATSAGIGGARVVALDANRAPASDVVATDPDGVYTLSVPAPRNQDGVPQASNVTLRADAQDYQSFPGGVRAALPIDLSTATSQNGKWVVDSALTDVGLIPLPDTSNLLSISGTVQKPQTRVGLLVVAAPQTGGALALTAIAGGDGSYKICNVPGSATGISYDVNAYGRGLNYTPVPATVTIGSSPPVANISLKNTTTATINGSLIFNQATPPTSVALVVEPTYDTTLDRGEAPPGLVAQVASGSTYTIAGIPDGTYIALAAFGIDGDVRDLSGVGNTAPIEVVIDNGQLVGTLGQFKLVGAVELTSIDGITVPNSGIPIQVTSSAPVLEWAKAPSYSSAANYEVQVFDAFGTLVWAPGLVSGSGSGPFNATYAGDPLTSGMYYQLRIKALDGSGNVLSQTEDLKGVFYK